MKLYLAPLAEITDAPFRRMCYEGGADLCYTEMVSAAALLHGSSPTRHLMETMPGEGPVACQFFGSTEEELANAAREAEKVRERFVEVNLNAGCPMPRIVKSGAGAALVKDPNRVYRLLKAMRENTSLPVTLKTRLGPEPQTTTVFELLDAARDAGASAFIVHARYTSQMHGGNVHLDTLSEVAARSTMPVVGNGGVRSLNDLKSMAKTGVQAVMIGRGALFDPAIFARFKGEPARIPDDGLSPIMRHIGYLLAFREQLARNYPGDHIPSEDGLVSVKMHRHLFRYFTGRKGAPRLRRRLTCVRTLAEVLEAVDEFNMENAAEQVKQP